jgi:transposase InsO family protein
LLADAVLAAARAEAKKKLFDYIEVFYNHQRRHSSLDYGTLAGYEKAARAAVATA